MNDAVMIQALVCVSYIGTSSAAEYDSWARLLVLEDVSVGTHFLATSISVAALEFNFGE